MGRAIAVVVFPGFQLLDAAGPTAAFEIAERFRPGSYDLALLAPGGGEVESSSGLRLSAEPLGADPFDTVVVSGGEIICSIAAAREIIAWLGSTKVRRIASVCSGAYLLAEAGLLDGRRATTHWNSTHDFGRRYPKVELDAERIFIRDGDVWTSAGISAGVDLALALIEDDLGPEAARRTAQQLVVHPRRPGGQVPLPFSPLVGPGRWGGRLGRHLRRRRPGPGPHRGRPRPGGGPPDGAATRRPPAPARRAVAVAVLVPGGARRADGPLRRAGRVDAGAPRRAADRRAPRRPG